MTTELMADSPPSRTATPDFIPSDTALTPAAPQDSKVAVAPLKLPPLAARESHLPPAPPPALPSLVANAEPNSFSQPPLPVVAPGHKPAAPANTAPAIAIPVPVVQLPHGGQTITSEDVSSDASLNGLEDGAGSSQGGAHLLTPKASRRRWSHASKFFVRSAIALLLLIASALYCASPSGQRLIRPIIIKIHQWNTARTLKPPGWVPPTPANSPDDPKTASAENPASNARRTEHEEIARLLLTERTQTYVYADLRILIPAYNLMASQQGLPSQREMSESLKQAYGVMIDPFDQLTILQSDTKDEFLLILSAKTPVNLDKVIGQSAPPDFAGTSRLYSIKAGQRSLGAVLYDPFTLLLGSPNAVNRAHQPTSEPPLREATCMFPATAQRKPGALIIVKRINLPPLPGAGSPSTAFETIVTNLFINSATPSILTLTRNPDVTGSDFVGAAATALKEQVAELAPSLSTEAAALANLTPGEINVTLEEASVSLPGGHALINAALQSMARSFARPAPTINTILQAQDLVTRFNFARATGASSALNVTSSQEAIELINDGIRGGGRASGAIFQFRSKPEELNTLSALLAFDKAIGLVYRPDAEQLTGSSYVLALKARDYRNAELLTTLGQQAGLTALDTDTAESAAQRVITWANSEAGSSARSKLGLPNLTPEELAGALRHLAVINKQLSFKAGELNYRGWVRLVHPDPRRDATKLAATFNAAFAAGAIPASATRDLQTALNLLAKGVSGRGAKANSTYKVDLTPAELAAAATLLALEDRTMKVTATPTAPVSSMKPRQGVP